MRRSIFASVCATVAAACLFAPAAQAPATAGFDPGPFLVQTKDVAIPGSTPGVALDALVYQPAPAPVHPLVIFPASWATPKLEYDAVARSLAARGYVGIAYTLRGFYGSTGEITLAGPEDQADLSRVISWGLANTAATPGRVGTFGISYGAGIGLLGAQTDPRIRAVVALSGWTDLQGSMLSGNTVAKETVGLLGDSAKLVGRPSAVLTQALAAADAGDVGSLIPLAQNRSPGRHLADVNRNGAAIMIGNGWQDSLLPADQFFATWDKLTVPKKLMLSPGDHVIAEGGGLAGLPNDYADAGKAWLDHFLLGIANGAATQGPVLVKPTYGGSAYTALPSLNALRRSAQRKYLGKPGSRSITAAAPSPWSASYTGGKESSAVIGTILASGASYALGRPPTSRMSLIDPASSVTWQTGPLGTGITLGGMSAVHMRVTPSATKATVIAYLYDVNQSGVGTLLSWKPWTGRNLTPGASIGANITLEPVFAPIAAGHRLAVVVDSVEERYRSETTAGQRVTLSGTAADPAYIDIAVR